MARRILAPILSLVVVGASWLTAPATAAAASGVVTFPAEASGEGPLLDNLRQSGGACITDVHADAGPVTGTWTTGFAISSTNCRNGATTTGPDASVLDMAAYVGSTVRWQGLVSFSTTGNRTYTIDFCSTGSGACTEIAGASASQVITEDVAFGTPDEEFAIEIVVPAGARRAHFHVGGNYSYYCQTTCWELVVVTPGEGGDCYGVGSLNGTAVTGSPGDEWGAYWSPSRDACLSAYIGWQTVVWLPGLFAFDEGAGYCLVDQWIVTGTSTIGRPKVKAYWVGAFGQTVGLIYDYYSGTGTATVCKEAPAGVWGISWVMQHSLYQVSHEVRDAVGDDLEVYGNGTKPLIGLQRSPSHASFEDCELPLAGPVPILSDLTAFLFGSPAEITNPVDYIPYGICLMVVGFEQATDWLGDIFDALVAGASDGIGGLADAVGEAFTEAIEFLFVPSTLGDDWQDFIDMVSGKVPFGWFAQVSDAIGDALDAPADALGSFTLPLAGSSVSIGAQVQGALTAVAPFRGLILAGVTLTFVLGCLRWIMAAVGVSPGHQSEGSS